MKNIFATLLILLTSTPTWAQEAPMANRSSIGHSRKTMVHDPAKLINPTLHQKLQSELTDYAEQHHVHIYIATALPTDLLSIEQYANTYIQGSSDVLILLSTQTDIEQLHIIATADMAAILPVDTCMNIAKRMNSKWLVDKQYETALIETVGCVKKQVKEHRQIEHNPITMAIVVLAAIVAALVLYKIGRYGFRYRKRKMCDEEEDKKTD